MLEVTTTQMFPMYDTRYFTQIYPDVETFINDYKNCGLPIILNDQSLTTLFYLLYGRYGNNPIKNFDENQFRYKLMGLIFQYGPTWEKRYQLQTDIRQLTVQNVIDAGNISINNHAFNDGSAPSTLTSESIPFTNDQTTFKHKKSLTDANLELWGMLKTDISNDFLDKFKRLFSSFVLPGATYIYETEEE